MPTLIAIIFPPLTMLRYGRASFLCLLLMVTVIGWPIASIWAIRVIRAGAKQGHGGRWVKVVGESHYQDALVAICGEPTGEGVKIATPASLVLKAGNPYDADAVRVDIQGRPVGHLDRETAVTFRRRVGKSIAVNACITGGWTRRKRDLGHFVVTVKLPG